jgi:MarR family transcriptional regulator, transcriptional regulator for hemolysin
MIDRLEGGGLVERRIDAADRRINRIHVTPRGHRVLDRMVAVGRRLNEVILDGLAPADLAVADQVLTRLRRNLRSALGEQD